MELHEYDLISWRRDLGLSQDEASELLGCKETTYIELENMDPPFISAEVLMMCESARCLQKYTKDTSEDMIFKLYIPLYAMFLTFWVIFDYISG